jgi:hypothetical protein
MFEKKPCRCRSIGGQQEGLIQANPPGSPFRAQEEDARVVEQAIALDAAREGKREENRDANGHTPPSTARY